MKPAIIPGFSTVYSRIMPDSRSFLLFRKLCRHNRRMPSQLKEATTAVDLRTKQTGSKSTGSYRVKCTPAAEVKEV